MSEELVVQRDGHVYAQVAAFELVQRRAKAFAESTLVPKEYQRNLANCVVAIEIADRVGYSPLMVMQNLYVVHGRPGWSAQYIIAAMNSCGRFKPLDFDISGKGDDYGCVAWTEDKNGRRLESSRITIKMAKDEGWYDKNGSKWKTMPEQMLRYRSASFLGKIYAPDILMGLQTAEEIEDVYAGEPRDVTPQVSELSKVIDEAKKQSEEKKEEPVAVVQEQLFSTPEEPKQDSVELIYSTAMASIADSKSREELEEIVFGIKFDQLSVEMQDAINKASARRFADFNKKGE